MTTYRCFFLDLDNRLVDVDVGEHDDDQAANLWGARLLARSPRHEYAVEVWQRERLVCRHQRASQRRR